jgi:hypothetical protein
MGQHVQVEQVLLPTKTKAEKLHALLLTSGIKNLNKSILFMLTFFAAG